MNNKCLSLSSNAKEPYTVMYNGYNYVICSLETDFNREYNWNGQCQMLRGKNFMSKSMSCQKYINRLVLAVTTVHIVTHTHRTQGDVTWSQYLTF